MVRRLSVCLIGIVVLAFGWACGPTATNNTSIANKAPASNVAGPNNSGTAANSSAASAPSDRKAEVTTTAEALQKEYKADPGSMQKYKGKVVEISGKFNAGGSIGDAITVKFETGEPSYYVTCRVHPSAIQAAAKFEKGQQIKMTGIGDPVSMIGPLFNDCQIAQ